MNSTVAGSGPAKVQTVTEDFSGVWDRFTQQVNRLDELANRILGAQPPATPAPTDDMPMTLPNFAPRLEIQRQRLAAIIDRIEHLA